MIIRDNIYMKVLKDMLKADNIKIDLISKNIEIFMSDSDKKIEIISKN